MGDVGRAISDVTKSVFRKPEEAVYDFVASAGRFIIRPGDELNSRFIRQAALAQTIANIWPVAQTATMLYDLTFKNRDLKWYHYLYLLAGPVGFLALAGHSYQLFQEKARREKNRAENMEAEFLSEQAVQLKRATAAIAAGMATGELRLFQSKIAATFVGNGTFVTDDKPAEWRILERMYNINLISSEEYVRQNASNWNRPFQRDDDIMDAFVSSARLYRSRW